MYIYTFLFFNMDEIRHYSEHLLDMLDPNSMGYQMIPYLVCFSPKWGRWLSNIDMNPYELLGKGIEIDITNIRDCPKHTSEDEDEVWEYFPPMSQVVNDKEDGDLNMDLVCAEGLLHLKAIQSHYIYNVNGTCADKSKAIYTAYTMQQSGAKTLEEYYASPNFIDAVKHAE